MQVPRSAMLMRGVAVGLVLIGGACQDSEEGNEAESVSTSTPATLEVGAPISDPCEVVTAAEASELVGVPMRYEPESVEGPVASCKYVSADSGAADQGRVLSQLRIDIYEGSQYFDLDGVGYPKDERDDVFIGDRGFVHRGDAYRGVTVQFEIGETVYQVNATEQAILTDQPADAGRLADPLVALLAERFADWTV